MSEANLGAIDRQRPRAGELTVTVDDPHASRTQV